MFQETGRLRGPYWVLLCLTFPACGQAIDADIIVPGLDNVQDAHGTVIHSLEVHSTLDVYRTR